MVLIWKIGQASLALWPKYSTKSLEAHGSLGAVTFGLHR